MTPQSPLTPRDRYKRLVYFFPFRLLVLHLKRNHFLLFLWLMLFGFASGTLASRFGVPQQFLVPEYRGGTGFISFAIVGFALGGFIEAFNLYTYILHAYRFPFIATLSKPFLKFSLNNFILPLSFLLTYTITSISFQINEFIPGWKVLLNILSLYAGIAVFLSITYFYFSRTNKEAQQFGKARKKKKHNPETEPTESPVHSVLHWFKRSHARQWHVETYLSHPGRISLARDSTHYSKSVLDKVFSQNHINASRFEIVLVLTFLLIGSLRENQYFILPAAASALLFFTMMLMLVSAFFSWIKGWTITLLFILLFAGNVFYSELRVLTYQSRAYGLDYTGEKAEYDIQKIITDTTLVQADFQHTVTILDNWRKKHNATTLLTGEKPKLIIINCSGGGSRSAFWTMRSLMQADSMLDGKLLNQCVLITGASGGMVGASYLREIMLRETRGENFSVHDTLYAEHMALDLLNPVMLSIATNDWFVRYQKYHDGPFRYTKDRGYAFEKQLKQNTRNLFPLRMFDYQKPEENAEIPMMIFSPTIVNDGRRMIISPQPLSYLTAGNRLDGEKNPLPEDIEFGRLFKKQRGDSLQFTTALRMNATFPYIFPMTSLPTKDPMELMDAGIRDNFGLKTTLQYLYTFRNWINTNTSGVIIVQVRDLPKGIDIEKSNQSLFSQFTAPLGSIYGNMTKTHDYNSEQMLRYLTAWFDNSIDLVTFQLQHDEKNFVSLSWHLTEAEKRTIRSGVKSPYYLKELERLGKMLE